MNYTAHNIAELRQAITDANKNPGERHEITLKGTDADYIVTDFADFLFGWNAFPNIKSNITIQGGYRVLSMTSGLIGRFFAINAKDGGHPNASLTLRRVILTGGNSGDVGGGAIVNDGKLELVECGLTKNVGSLGGAVYNGDDCDCTATDTYFQQNRATAEATSIYGAHNSSLTLRRCTLYDDLDVTCVVNNITQPGRQQLLTQGCIIIGKISIAASGQDLEIGGSGSGTPLITPATSQPVQNWMLQSKAQSTLGAGYYHADYPQKSQWSIDDLSPAISNLVNPTATLSALLAEERFDVIRDYLQASHDNPTRYPLQPWLLGTLIFHPGVQYIRFYYDMMFLAAELNLIDGNGQASMFSIVGGGMRFLLQSPQILDYLRSDALMILERTRERSELSNRYLLSDSLVVILQEMLLRGYPLGDDITLQALWAALDPITPYVKRFKRMPLKLTDQEAAVPFLRGDAYAPYLKKPITMSVTDAPLLTESRPETQPTLAPTDLPNWYVSANYKAFWEMPGYTRLYESDEPIDPRWVEDNEFLQPFLPGISEYAPFNPTRCSTEWMIYCWYQWIYWYEVQHTQGGDSWMEYRWALWKLLAAILDLGEGTTFEAAYAGLSDCLIWQSSPPKPGQQLGNGTAFIIVLPGLQRVALLNPTPRTF
jgi:hypothetical protein